MRTVLKTQNLAVKTPTGSVLECKDMEIKSGELVAIVGSLSSGKSLLLSSLAGLFPVAKGDLQIFDVNVSNCNYQYIQKMRVKTGFVFEIGGLLSNLSLYDNIGLPLRYHFKKLKKEAVDRQIQKVMNQFSIMDYSGLRPNDVPLEVRKRSLFCRALVMRPKLLFLDEPFVGLGFQGRRIVKDVIEKIVKKGEMTIITSMSEADIVYSLASKFIIMANKEIQNIVNGKQELEQLCQEDCEVSNLFREV